MKIVNWKLENSFRKWKLENGKPKAKLNQELQ
jgi:hypothetical protein